MIRYFMTITEASKLVIQAGSYGKVGEVFLLKMGDLVKIADLASDLIKLAGLEEGKDIKIEFTGVRPGEKLYEELLTAEEGITATRNKKIYIARAEEVDEEKLMKQVHRLHDAAMQCKRSKIIELLKDCVISFASDRDNVYNEPRSKLERPEKTSRPFLKVV